MILPDETSLVFYGFTVFGIQLIGDFLDGRNTIDDAHALPCRVDVFPRLMGPMHV